VKSQTAVAALAALAQETRLAVFRALVQAGSEGLPAGRIAAAVGAPASTLSFHLKELAAAGLVRSRQDGRFIFYTANYAAMSELVAFLTEKCCQGMPAPQVARIGQAVASCCTPQTAVKPRTGT
jgi:ArsR family transcriptional regulator, arsenate/arsenite/antimonite-responsive transcriptional repressor